MGEHVASSAVNSSATVHARALMVRERESTVAGGCSRIGYIFLKYFLSYVKNRQANKLRKMA